jgi:hypothetical protein
LVSRWKSSSSRSSGDRPLVELAFHPHQREPDLRRDPLGEGDVVDVGGEVLADAEALRGVAHRVAAFHLLDVRAHHHRIQDDRLLLLGRLQRDEGGEHQEQHRPRAAHLVGLHVHGD